MGNSLGDMDAYRALLEKHPTFQGGYVWDYIDQGLMVNGKLCYGGDHFDRPNDKDFCCNGIIFADRHYAETSSKAQALKYYYQNLHFTYTGQEIEIKNQNLFRDTSELQFEIMYTEDGNVVRKDDFRLNVAAGEKKCYPIAQFEETGKEQMYQIPYHNIE